MSIFSRIFIVVIAALAGAGVLAGCGQQPPGPAGAPPPAPAPAFNDADVMFAQQMIPHHQMAIQMSGMAREHTQSQQVKDLAARIEAAQQPEIQTMSGWLRAWGKPVPSMGPGIMMPNMPGMPSQGDMSHMMGMSGQEFDRVFLQMMIIHHQDAVKMAKTEQARGLSPDAKQLARSIETSQTAEISQMQQMLSR